MTKLDKNKDSETHLAVEPPSESKEEKLFSDEVFKDDLEFEDDIDKLPL
ncbi:MAG: hypothetical protein NUV64_02645 [Parcubacteria group bacterium]|nr:hypothetical protein [Parcubacteria group bacterium]MCR4342704.1 hypothetical protein [Patescibacteria group bacterium]